MEIQKISCIYLLFYSYILSYFLYYFLRKSIKKISDLYNKSDIDINYIYLAESISKTLPFITSKMISTIPKIEANIIVIAAITILTTSFDLIALNNRYNPHVTSKHGIARMILNHKARLFIHSIYFTIIQPS